MTPNKQTIIVSASVLKWARRTLFGGKIEEAASKLKVTTQELKEWETNNPTITLTLLKRLSKVYKRHVSVLLLSTPPISQQPPKFRKLLDFENATFDKATFLAIRQAQEIQNRTIYLLENKQNQFIKELQKYSKQSQVLASKVISFLGIAGNNRFKSKNSKEQLTIWKRLLEAKGVLVLEINFPISDSRAFVLYNEIAPIIVLNSKDADNARIFSLFHELGHLVLGQTDFDDELNLNLKETYRDEIFCNIFAASLLVPKDLLANSISGITSFNDINVKKIANIFKVSTAVIWRRLRDENHINITQFNLIKNKLSVFEPFTNPNLKKKFVANKNTYLYTTIKRKSEMYISEVFEAFNQNRITYYDVMDYIGIKSDHVTRLQRLMFT